MKIYISADMEGTNGVVSPSDIIPGQPGYERARLLMTKEVNMVVAGLFDEGADSVTVCDSHELADNIVCEELDKRVEFIRGASRPDSMVHGIDKSYDGLILLGHHAMFGAYPAVLDHTYDQLLVRELRLGKKLYGEAGINALCAAECGVPLIMASGDDALKREIEELGCNAQVAVVKEAQGRYCAKCLPFNESDKLLYDTAREAIKNISNIKRLEIPKNLVLELVFQQTCMADGALRVHGVKRTGAFSIEYVAESMRELMQMRQVIQQAAAEFFDRRF